METQTDNFTIGRELAFDVYGDRIRGKFISIKKDVIKINVINDSSGVTKRGEMAEIHKTFLVEKKSDVELEAKTGKFIKEAFCITGDAQFLYYENSKINGVQTEGMIYECTDTKRGTFYVTISRPK